MEISKLIDIKLNADWQPVPEASGDFLQTVGQYECLMQELALEALTQEGDLFTDEYFGWSLLDFIHSEVDSLLEIEIKQRIKGKLSWYDEINASSIKIEMKLSEDKHMISVGFKFIGDEDIYKLQLQLDRVNAEVVIVSG